MRSSVDQTQKRPDAELKSSAPHILAIDIGGTLIKASVIDGGGGLIAPWMRVQTPKNATPESILVTIGELAQQLPPYSKISVAFPGVVSRGIVRTAPNLAADVWRGHNLRKSVQDTFGCDARILNDAVVQGLGVARGPGLECVLTLGTGLGFALFRDGAFVAQLELGQYGSTHGQKFDDYVGHAAYVSIGEDAWNGRVAETFDIVRGLVTPNRILVGGGNARRITFQLPEDIELFPMTAGVTGGARLWGDNLEPFLASEFA